MNSGMDDPFKSDPTVKRWVRHVLEDMVPKMRDSTFVIEIVPDPEKHGPGDVKFWVELGASIMMDKPIIAAAFHAQQIPRKLAMVADEIVRMPEGVSPESSERMAAVLARVAHRLDSGELTATTMPTTRLERLAEVERRAHDLLKARTESDLVEAREALHEALRASGAMG